MKAKGLFISLIACLSCVAGNPEASQVRGYASCGEWTQQHTGSGTASTWVGAAQEKWILGYLSGWAMSSDKDFMRDVDTASVSLWVTNYCRANPLNDVADAGLELGHELIRRKGL